MADICRSLRPSQRKQTGFSLVEKRGKWWQLVGNPIKVSKQTAHIMKEVTATFIEWFFQKFGKILEILKFYL